MARPPDILSPKGIKPVLDDYSLISGEPVPTLVYRNPLGPVRITYARDDHELEIVPEELPLTVEVYLYDVSGQDRERITCELDVGGVTYEGNPTVSREDLDLGKNERAPMNFKSWYHPEVNEPCCLYFPHNEEVFEQIKRV